MFESYSIQILFASPECVWFLSLFNMFESLHVCANSVHKAGMSKTVSHNVSIISFGFMESYTSIHRWMWLLIPQYSIHLLTISTATTTVLPGAAADIPF